MILVKLIQDDDDVDVDVDFGFVVDVVALQTVRSLNVPFLALIVFLVMGVINEVMMVDVITYCCYNLDYDGLYDYDVMNVMNVMMNERNDVILEELEVELDLVYYHYLSYYLFDGMNVMNVMNAKNVRNDLNVEMMEVIFV